MRAVQILSVTWHRWCERLPRRRRDARLAERQRELDAKVIQLRAGIDRMVQEQRARDVRDDR